MKPAHIRAMEDNHPTCALCHRPIPPDVRQSVHHLIPRLRGGKNGATVLLHQICHNEIHATLTETDLARHYNTPEAPPHPSPAGQIGRMAARQGPGVLPAQRRGTTEKIDLHRRSGRPELTSTPPPA